MKNGHQMFSNEDLGHHVVTVYLHNRSLNDNDASVDLFVSCCAVVSGVLASVVAEGWQVIIKP